MELTKKARDIEALVRVYLMYQHNGNREKQEAVLETLVDILTEELGRLANTPREEARPA